MDAGLYNVAGLRVEVYGKLFLGGEKSNGQRVHFGIVPGFVGSPIDLLGSYQDIVDSLTRSNQESTSSDPNLADLVHKPQDHTTGLRSITHPFAYLASERPQIPNESSVIRFSREESEGNDVYNLLVTPGGIEVYRSRDYSERLSETDEERVIGEFVSYANKTIEGRNLLRVLMGLHLIKTKKEN